MFTVAADFLLPVGHSPWIAYHSDETGPIEVYVQRFPDLGDRQRISTAGGRQPLWSRDGRELFYSDGQRMMSVSIDRESTFTPGTPEVVFERQYLLTSPSMRDYDLHRMASGS